MDDFSCISAGFQGLFYYTINDDGVHATNPADPALIVAAVNALPALLAERERLREALEWLVGVIDAAGPLNLSNGVQLGQTAWYVKCMDAMANAAAALGSKP